MNIPYGKIIIYVLTFVGYAYTGYGAGLLSNLKNAVIAAENVFGDVMKNVVKIAEKFRNLNDVFDAAVEEDCIFKCPGGSCLNILFNNSLLNLFIIILGSTPKPNRNHVPKANGCGSLGLQISSDYLPVSDMTKCCDLHDICYDTCNNNKEVCDMEFKRCLYKYCDTHQSKVGDTLVKGYSQFITTYHTSK